MTDPTPEQQIGEWLEFSFRSSIAQVMQEYEKAGRDPTDEVLTEAVNEGITRAKYDHGHEFVSKLDDPNTCVHCDATKPAPAEGDR